MAPPVYSSLHSGANRRELTRTYRDSGKEFFAGLTNRKLYYGWVVVWVVFAALLVSAGVRAAPTVLINPLESELGWGRPAISAAISIGLLLYGLSGPAAGWLMDRFGPKPLTLFGLVLIGLRPLMGAARNELLQPQPVLGALRSPVFWLLSGSFFICGASSNGIIGVHFVPHSIDHGIPEVTAASVLAIMGAMNFVGTLASGWLTDRYDPRKLLAIYYSLRGLSLLLLPFVTEFAGLTVFAVFFGLDYIATVPPTVALVADRFGRANVGAVFGWVFFAHQIGAALASYLGGVIRVSLGDYTAAFLGAGILAILASLMVLVIRREPTPFGPEAARAYRICLLFTRVRGRSVLGSPH